MRFSCVYAILICCRLCRNFVLKIQLQVILQYPMYYLIKITCRYKKNNKYLIVIATLHRNFFKNATGHQYCCRRLRHDWVARLCIELCRNGFCDFCPTRTIAPLYSIPYLYFCFVFKIIFSHFPITI